jgi:ribosome-associated protein
MEITPTIVIPDEELRFTFARSGGPGGQNVNKVASKAVLRWDLAGNTTLPADVKDRLRAQQRRRITSTGEMVIHGQRYRDQGRNVEDCIERLHEMVRQALDRPRPRKATRPSRGARERRLADKRQHAQRKARRRRPGPDD